MDGFHLFFVKDYVKFASLVELPQSPYRGVWMMGSNNGKEVRDEGCRNWRDLAAGIEGALKGWKSGKELAEEERRNNGRGREVDQEE